MKFPQHVYEVMDCVQEFSCDEQRIFHFLTEAKDSKYQNDLARMWKAVFKVAQESNGALDNKWVYRFVCNVRASEKEKPYFSMSRIERTEKLGEIEKYSKKLKKIYDDLGIDDLYLLLDPTIFYFEVKPELIEDIEAFPRYGVSEVIDFYMDVANEEVGGYKQVGKIGKNHKMIRFIRELAKRNRVMYGGPFPKIIQLVVLALYNKEYSDADLFNIINGRKHKKNRLYLQS